MFDCKAGTFLRSKVNAVTNPNAPAANHSGTAAEFKPYMKTLYIVIVVCYDI